MITKAVCITYGDEQIIVEVDIRITAEAAERMHLNDTMILSALAMGKPLTFFSRHNERKTIIEPISVCEVEHIREAA